MTVEGMVSRASKAGFRNSDSPYTRFLFGRYSYQHLSEYYPAVLGNDAVPADFRNLYLVMQLDHDYQAILLRYIGMFELQLRARYSMEMSVKYGAFAHRKPSCFKNQRYYDKFLREYAKVHEACLSHSSSRAAKDIASYGDMPIWEAVEEMPFGMISRLFKNTKNRQIKEAVARSFGVDQSSFANWLSALTVVRNRCAHFGKLLGSDLAIVPRAIENVSVDNRNPFFIALLLMHLLRTNAPLPNALTMPQVLIATDLYTVMSRYDAAIRDACGIPSNWTQLLGDPDVGGINIFLGSDFEKDNEGNPVVKERHVDTKMN